MTYSEDVALLLPRKRELFWCHFLPCKATATTRRVGAWPHYVRPCIKWSETDFLNAFHPMEGRYALQEIMYLWCVCLWYAMSSWIMTHHNYEKLQDCIHHNDDTQPWSVEEHGSVFWKRRFSSVSQDCISQNSVYKGYCIVDRGSVIELKQRRKQPVSKEVFFLYNKASTSQQVCDRNTNRKA